MALIPLIGGLSLIFLRVTLKVEKGQLEIQNKPVQITSFQITEPLPQAQIIYLKNYKSQWIIMPMTLEELTSRRSRPINREVNQAQLLEKRKMINALSTYLSNQVARVGGFPTLSSTLIFWSGLWLIMMIAAMGMLLVNH